MISSAPAPWFFLLLNLHLVPSAEDVERARVLKEEGNELVKKGNHKKAIEKYSESLSFSNLESATYSNRYLPLSCWPGDFRMMVLRAVAFPWAVMGSSPLAFRPQNTHSRSFGHCEAGVARGVRSLKGTETEGRQRGAWALLALPPPQNFHTTQISRRCQ